MQIHDYYLTWPCGIEPDYVDIFEGGRRIYDKRLVPLKTAISPYLRVFVAGIKERIVQAKILLANDNVNNLRPQDVIGYAKSVDFCKLQKQLDELRRGDNNEGMIAECFIFKVLYLLKQMVVVVSAAGSPSIMQELDSAMEGDVDELCDRLFQF